jgi:hypothetical protein
MNCSSFPINLSFWVNWTVHNNLIWVLSLNPGRDLLKNKKIPVYFYLMFPPQIFLKNCYFLPFCVLVSRSNIKKNGDQRGALI